MGAYAEDTNQRCRREVSRITNQNLGCLILVNPYWHLAETRYWDYIDIRQLFPLQVKSEYIFYSGEMKVPANTLPQLFLIWAVSFHHTDFVHTSKEKHKWVWGLQKWGIQVNEGSRRNLSKKRGSFKQKLPTRVKRIKTWVPSLCGGEETTTTNSSPPED